MGGDDFVNGSTLKCVMKVFLCQSHALNCDCPQCFAGPLRFATGRVMRERGSREVIETCPRSLKSRATREGSARRPVRPADRTLPRCPRARPGRAGGSVRRRGRSRAARLARGVPFRAAVAVDRREADQSLKSLIVTVPATIPVFSAAQEVMDGIVGFHIHRGVLALGRRSPMPTADDLLAGRADAP